MLQIWVTAISVDDEIATLEGEPSHVPHWLPGQPLLANAYQSPLF